MTRPRANPVRIHEIEGGQKLLREIQERLRERGQNAARFNQHGREDLIDFDIMTGLSVYDHGARQADIQCIACPNHPALQYEFIIEDLAGGEHRPIGSTCILKRSLSEAEAERYGVRLNKLASRYFRPAQKHKKQAHNQEHARLRREQGTGRNYLNALGLGWLPQAEVVPNPWVVLTPEDKAVVRAVTDTKRHLTVEEFARFQELDRERAEREARGVTLADERAQRPQAPAPRRIPVATPIVKVKPKTKKPNFDRLKYATNPQPLPEEEWGRYIRHVGYDYDETDWERVERHLPRPKVKKIRQKMQRRVPLSEDDISALWRADQLERERQTGHLRRAQPLYRLAPLTPEQASEELIKMLHAGLYGGGYQAEWRLFQALADIPAWIEEHLGHDLNRVRTLEIQHLASTDLNRISKQIHKHRDWAPPEPQE